MSKVREYIDNEFRKERYEKYEKVKQFMFSEGIYDIVYFEKNDGTEYPCYDEINKRRYKKVPIPMTEEFIEVNKIMEKKEAEKAELEKAKKEVLKKTESEEEPVYGKGLASALVILGVIIIIVGFIVGCSIGTETYSSGRSSVSEFHFEIAYPYWIQSLIGGFIMIGIGKIIDILHFDSFRK